MNNIERKHRRLEIRLALEKYQRAKGLDEYYGGKTFHSTAKLYKHYLKLWDLGTRDGIIKPLEYLE